MSQVKPTHILTFKPALFVCEAFRERRKDEAFLAYQQNAVQWGVEVDGGIVTVHKDHIDTCKSIGLVKLEASIKGEADPEGLGLNRHGAKADAGKSEYDMALFSFPNALAHVDRVGKFGVKKYTKGGFLSVPNGEARYNNAGIRHNIKHLSGEAVDEDSGELHLAHKAWNALAELELYLRAKKK